MSLRDKVGTKANIGVFVLLKVIFLFGVHEKSKLHDTNVIQLLIKSVLWCSKTKSRGSYNSNKHRILKENKVQIGEIISK